MSYVLEISNAGSASRFVSFETATELMAFVIPHSLKEWSSHTSFMISLVEEYNQITGQNLMLTYKPVCESCE